MSLLRKLGLIEPVPAPSNGNAELRASELASVIWPDSLLPEGFEHVVVSRRQAMQVPAVARARNIIAGTIAELPVKLQRPDGSRIASTPPWVEQPESGMARAVTLAWTVDDLIFYGASYWQVADVYAEDNRPMRFSRVDPTRIGVDRDRQNPNLVLRWLVDGKPVQHSGRGSLVVIRGLDEGVLYRGGRTIRTALELEKVSNRYAREPLPLTVLKNEGVDLPPPKVRELLSNWRQARRQNATAYLNASVSADTVGFDPKAMQLNEARQYMATELARLMNVPAWFVHAEIQSSFTYSNVTQERRALVDLSLRHYIAAIEQRLSMPDVLRAGWQARFDLSDFLRGDPKERADVYKILIDSGVIDPDEAREQEDLTPRGSN